MSNKLKLEESLSALMDNEVDDLELRRILKELPEAAHLQDTWERYHLISATIRQESHSRASIDILSAVQLELENEPVPVYANADKASGNKSVFRVFGQGAIAASVVFAVLFSVGTMTGASSVTTNQSLEVASNTSQISPSSPVFNGNYTASEFSRVVSSDAFNDEAARDHLKAAVYQSFGELPEVEEIQFDVNILND